MDDLWSFVLALATGVLFVVLGLITLVVHLVRGKPPDD